MWPIIRAALTDIKQVWYSIVHCLETFQGRRQCFLPVIMTSSRARKIKNPGRKVAADRQKSNQLNLTKGTTTHLLFLKKNTHVKYNKMPDKDKGIERKRNNTKLYQEKSCKLYNYCGTLHMERIDCKFCLPSPVDLLSGMLEGIICLMANEGRTWEICIWEICGELMLSTCMSVGHKGTGLGLGDGADQTSLKN